MAVQLVYPSATSYAPIREIFRQGELTMALTMDEALNATMFHDVRCNKWRRNGMTKTWKTRPTEFRIPVKYGLYKYGYIRASDNCHTAESCPNR